MRQRPTFTRRALAVLAVGAAIGFFGHVPVAFADPPKVDAVKAEVRVLHATNNCDNKSAEGQKEAKALGFACLALLDKKLLPLVLNQPSTTPLPNGRTFQLLHTARVDTRYKVTASISPADKSPGYTKLADITADPNKPFNVGGFAYQGGVLVLSIRIVPGS